MFVDVPTSNFVVVPATYVSVLLNNSSCCSGKEVERLAKKKQLHHTAAGDFSELVYYPHRGTRLIQAQRVFIHSKRELNNASQH